MTDDFLLQTLKAIQTEMSEMRKKIDKLVESIGDYKVVTEGRITKVEIRSGWIAVIVSAAVAVVGWLTHYTIKTFLS